MPPTEVDGFMRGDRVMWTGSSAKAPAGSVGTVVEFKSEDVVRVEYPNGMCLIKLAELRPEVSSEIFAEQ